MENKVYTWGITPVLEEFSTGEPEQGYCGGKELARNPATNV